ncbi:MAG: peptidylprolyl isomerase [Lachnospiraceae bacterium]
MFKVGNQNVYLDEVNLYCLENVAQLGITVEQLDTVVAEDGTAAPDYYKQEIFDLILDNKVTYMKAIDEGITLTKQEKESINSDAVAYIGSLNGSVTKQFGITMDTVKRSYEERYIVKKYGDKLFSEITVEEQRYATLYLLLFPKVQIDENGNYVTDTDGETPILLSEDEIKKAKEDADAALIELKNGADIAEVAKKYGVDLVSGQESNLVGSFSDPFEPYAQTLKNGELSPVLDIKSCYAIVQMMSENNEEIAQQITNYYLEDTKQEKMKESLATWYQEYEIEKDDVITGSAWDKLSLYDFSQYVEE